MDAKYARARAGLAALVLLGTLTQGCDDEDKDKNPAAHVDAGGCPPPADEDSGAPPMQDAGSEDAGALASLSCKIAVIGGGAGGLHTAFRLAEKVPEDVCLFEKENRLGGRIYDVSKDGKADSPRIGVGARRLLDEQPILKNLAAELGIEYAAPVEYDDVIRARGVTGYSSDELNAAAYPTLPDDADYETTLYEQLMALTDVGKYPDLHSYGQATIGAEGFQFLKDMSRFRADFEYPVDARGYMDYFNEEWTIGTYLYPKGGMSEFIRGMEAKARDAGVRIYLEEPALSIDRDGTKYVVSTPSHRVTAEKLVIGVDAGAFRKVQGKVAEDLIATEQFDQLIGVKVATITQWWPSAWWESGITGHEGVRRGRTTESCINVIEIPTDPYGGPQMVTRSVYDDDMACVAMWEQYIQQGNIEAIEAEILRGLKQLFPDATIPAPDKTFAHIWENAWYWQKAGSPFTNLEIAQWAVEPLSGEAISMVGESYNPQRSGWSDAAYKSSIATLNANFGFTYEEGDATKPPAMARILGSRKLPRNLRGH
jgi:glycine/D-amino acid oxidase-like deaminating enzyme